MNTPILKAGMREHCYPVYEPGGACRMETSVGPISLDKLQQLVGGYIEMHRYGKYTFVVNEDGRLRNLPTNQQFPEFRGTIVQGVISQDGEFTGDEAAGQQGGRTNGNARPS